MIAYFLLPLVWSYGGQHGCVVLKCIEKVKVVYHR